MNSQLSLHEIQTTNSFIKAILSNNYINRVPHHILYTYRLYWILHHGKYYYFYFGYGEEEEKEIVRRLRDLGYA